MYFHNESIPGGSNKSGQRQKKSSSYWGNATDSFSNSSLRTLKVTKYLRQTQSTKTQLVREQPTPK